MKIMPLLAVMLLNLGGCFGQDSSFVCTASYKPKSGLYQRVDIEASGVKPYNLDVVEDGIDVTVTFITLDNKQSVLRLYTSAARAYFAQDLPGTTFRKGMPLDESNMLAFMKSVGVNTSHQIVVKEARELIDGIQSTALGPKGGQRAVDSLILISSKSDYIK